MKEKDKKVIKLLQRNLLGNTDYLMIAYFDDDSGLVLDGKNNDITELFAFNNDKGSLENQAKEYINRNYGFIL